MILNQKELALRNPVARELHVNPRFKKQLVRCKKKIIPRKRKHKALLEELQCK